MGHMNWISTLNESDIQLMKQKIIDANPRDENIVFQGEQHSITYIQAVIKVWETNIVDPELLDNV
jgi:hypothetical protein|tara:strand:+ start:5714 stop:5908 length:195 start_codon:yes stop_codon:yes gene_type:complete